MEIIIKPKKNYWQIDLKELIQYRDLFYFLALRDIKVRYKQTAIGVLWAIFQPLITMIIFSVFFGTLTQVPSDNIPYPIFVYTGLLLWTFFSQALTNASGSMISNEQIIKKIYFPKILLPASAIFVSLIDLGIATIILFGMMFYYRVPLHVNFLLLFPLMILTYIASLGFGLLLAAINVKFRDVRYALPFFIQLLLFVTPVIYPASIVSSRYQWILYLNPMSGIIESTRAVVLNQTAIQWQGLGMAVLVSLLLFVIGLFYFRKTERYFADII